MKKYLDTKAESLENKITQIFGETVAKEGNKFTKALNAARENGKEYFAVDGKNFKTEDYAKEGFGANTPTSNQGVATIRRAQAAPKGGNRTNPGQLKPKTEAMDKVNPTAVKKKFDDRKDKDIDNDGDVDSTDKYLHKRRQAISKAVAKEEVVKEYNEIGTPEYTKHTLEVTPGQQDADWDKQVNVMHKKANTMREALAKVWGMDEGKNPFKKEEEKPLTKTMTGEKPTKVEVEPKIKQ